METYLLPILNDGGIAGLLVVVIVLTLGFLLRQKGWLFDRPAAPPSNNDGELISRINAVEDRLTRMEADMRNVPTRQELHALDVSLVALTERMSGLDRIGTATASAVNRIETFMIEASKRGGK